MVFFVCEGCNESLKKNQVDKHASRCHNCYAVTCVDCNVTFYGDDFRAHTSCISEAEKYDTMGRVRSMSLDQVEPISTENSRLTASLLRESWG